MVFQFATFKFLLSFLEPASEVACLMTRRLPKLKRSARRLGAETIIDPAILVSVGRVNHRLILQSPSFAGSRNAENRRSLDRLQ